MKKQRWMLLLLFIIFVAPGLVAYYVYTHPQRLGATTNQGTLLRPPVLVRAAWSGTKWRLVVWCPNLDLKHCERMLDRLARVRLALGRRLYDIDVVLLLPHDVDLAAWKTAHQRLMLRLHEYDLQVLTLQNDGAQLGDKSLVYLVDARQYAVLKYHAETKLDAIYHDIKKLLTNG